MKRLFVLMFAIVLVGWSASSVVAQAAQPPQPRWTYALSDGAAYGLGISESGDTLVAVIGFGFDGGAQIVSLDPATGSVRWQVETPEGALADPIVVDGVVYAGMGNLMGGGAAVYALDAATGAQRWRTDVENRDIPATPLDALTYADGTVYLNRGDATLLAIDAATGGIRWQLEFDKPFRGSPWVEGDTVFVATGFDGARVHALDAATGDEHWSVEETANPVTGPVLADGLLLVTYTDGALVAYEPSGGDERWRGIVGLRDDATEVDPRPGLPVVADGVIYVSSNGFAGAYTVALELQTGAELWNVSTGAFSAGEPTLFGGVLLVGSDSGDLLGLDPATGNERWRVAVPNKIDLDLNQASPPLVAGDVIFVRDDLGSVVALGAPR